MLGLLDLLSMELLGEMDNQRDEAPHLGFFAHARHYDAIGRFSPTCEV